MAWWVSVFHGGVATTVSAVGLSEPGGSVPP